MDQEFATASVFLKQVLKQYTLGGKCLDVPSGDGRNTFLLAGSFNEVVAVDISEKYLKAIVEEPGSNVVIRQADVLKDGLTGLESFDFVCNIHFYHEMLTWRLLNDMRPNAYLLLETPACHGENFRTLPNETELGLLLKNCEVLLYEFKQCKHPANKEQRGRLKTLIKIRKDA